MLFQTQHPQHFFFVISMCPQHCWKLHNILGYIVQMLVIGTQMCILCMFLCLTSCFIVQSRASISSFVNKPPTLMSIDAVILPLMVLIGLVIGGNCWPLSDRAFNDRLSLLRSKHSHHLQPYNFCDLNITSKKELCRF